MTGRSSDLSDPQWQYDELGTACLDTIVDFIRENNPDGLTATQWKDLYWQRALGLEHTSWGNPILGLNCGLGARMSARDQARVGQLWLNKGAWPGAPGPEQQLLDRDYAQTAGVSFVSTPWPWPAFPGASRYGSVVCSVMIDQRPLQCLAAVLRVRMSRVYSHSFTGYGYTVWTLTEDEIDPTAFSQQGLNAQCIFVSPEHDVVVVSMGNDEISNCRTVWDVASQVIVPTNHSRFTRSVAAAGIMDGDHEAMERALRAIADESLQNVTAVQRDTATNTTFAAEQASRVQQ
jgi:CubicO group peptidase (beta-lactamase class C family)